MPGTTAGKPPELVSSWPAPDVPSALSRRRFLALGGATVGALGAGAFLAACGGGSGSSVASAGPSDTLTVGVYQEPDTLDPGASGLILSSLIAAGIFDPLVWW